MGRCGTLLPSGAPESATPPPMAPPPLSDHAGGCSSVASTAVIRRVEYRPRTSLYAPEHAPLAQQARRPHVTDPDVESANSWASLMGGVKLFVMSFMGHLGE